MDRRLRAARLACIAVMALGAAVPVRAETRRALLVGIDHYVPADATQTAAAATAETPSSGTATRGRSRGAWTDLEGAVNDVEALRAILMARFGFKPADIRVLTNAQATRDRILDETRQWLIDGASPGDVSLFFYAGHGSQVRNSKSQETDKLDESIVPADANTGRPDIRDKELARLFDAAVDKKIVLTAIFDSCHSGSIGRGAPRPIRFRVLPTDERDVADPSTPVPPETRGALILSAAQDYQLAAEVDDENNHPHGLFTWALMKVLRSMPANESADRMFLRLRAVMQSGDTLQEPVLAATDERRHRSFFGVQRSDLSGRSVVAVQGIDGDGSVTLQGGIAAGLYPGAELRRLDEGPPVTLQVIDDQGLSRAIAKIATGSAAGVTPGALFEVTKWAAAGGPALRVWLGGTTLSLAEVSRVADALAPLGSTPGVSWVDDPAAGAAAPVTVVQHAASSWQLMTAHGTRPVGAATAAAVAPLLAADKTGARAVLVNLPLPSEVAPRLRLGAGTEADAVAVVASPEQADYILVGRRRARELEYAWVRPFVTATSGPVPALPARTDWVPLAAGAENAAARLRELAVRLAVIRGWLTLETPPDDGRFPYHLALKNSKSAQLRTSGETREGEGYGLVLTADPAALAPNTMDQRYVYVFTIDISGKSQLLFPRTSGNVENTFPGAPDAQGHLRSEILLGPPQLFKVSPPFGTDTYILLTSSIALGDPTVLDGAAVATRGSSDPLTRLLAQASAARRGSGITTPTDWSVERLTFQSVAAPAPKRNAAVSVLTALPGGR